MYLGGTYVTWSQAYYCYPPPPPPPEDPEEVAAEDIKNKSATMFHNFHQGTLLHSQKVTGARWAFQIQHTNERLFCPFSYKVFDSGGGGNGGGGGTFMAKTTHQLGPLPPLRI